MQTTLTILGIVLTALIAGTAAAWTVAGTMIDKRLYKFKAELPDFLNSPIGYRRKETCEEKMKVLMAEVGLIRHDWANHKTVLLGLTGGIVASCDCPKCIERRQTLVSANEE